LQYLKNNLSVCWLYIWASTLSLLKKIKPHWIILFTVVLLPLIVRVEQVAAPLDLNVWPVQNELFTYWKCALLFTVSPTLFFFSFKKVILAPYVYIFFICISGILTRHTEIVWYGLYNYREGMLTLICYMALFISSAHLINTDEKRKQLVYAVALSFLLVGLVAILQFLKIDVFNLRGINRIIRNGYEGQLKTSLTPSFSTLMNSNHLGLYCAMIFPFVAIEFKKWFIPFILFVSMTCYSRGAWASILITACLVFYYLYNEIDSKHLIILSFCVYAIAPKISKVNFDFNNNDRFYFWENTIPLLSVFGNGPQTLIYTFPNWNSSKKADNGINKDVMIDRPHNIFLQVWHDTGFFSLLCFLFFPIYFLLKQKKDRYSIAVSFSVIGYLIAACFTDSTVCVAPLYWIILGSGYAKL